MNQPKIKVIPINSTKEDKKRAKLMREFLNFMYPPKLLKAMMRQVVLREMERMANPLGIIKTYWKEPHAKTR